MSDTKWTPGPWSWDDEELLLEAPDPDEPENSEIGVMILECSSTACLPDRPERALIAAAPELYEALEAYVRMTDAPPAIALAARNALAKARGES